MDNRAKIVLIGFLIIAGFFLITEHRAHLYSNTQYLLFALFIFLHFFMHMGHGGHGDGKKGGHH